MPYYQASELLKNPNCKLIELINSLEDLSAECGYISAIAIYKKSPHDLDADLVRLLILIKLIRNRIVQHCG